jgi:FAD/FMN-containing dehydrogenase/Fe-S oxidoreductase
MYRKLKKLEKTIKGEIVYDSISRIIYSFDASMYEIKPLAIIKPKIKEDILKILDFAKNENIPIHPRGAGTGMAGQSLGRGIVLDFSKYLNNIIEIQDDYVRVEPGIVYKDLNNKIKTHFLFFPPDPSSGDICTIGGMISNNSSGSRSLKYKSTSEYVLNLEVLLPNGDIINTKNNTDILIIKNNIYESILCDKNVSGYNIILDKNKINLNKLFCGSEGTLGIILEATLALKQIPKKKIAVVIGFKDLKNALESIQEIRKSNPSCIELLDTEILNIVKSELKTDLDLKNTKAILLMEFEDENYKTISKNFDLSFFKSEEDQDRQNELWKIRREASQILNRVKGNFRVVRCIEDVCVPINRLVEFYNEENKIFARYNTHSAFFGHVGQGNFHLDPQIDITRPDFKESISGLMNDTYDLVISLGGSISGEHGDGILRSAFVKKQYPKSYELFKKIKKYFDPDNILNPGKIIVNDEKAYLDNLRFDKHLKTIKTSTKFNEEIFACHGCGLCRNYCPVFTALKDEIATGRAKANLIASFILGEIKKDEIKELKKIIDLCFACDRCLISCPTKVDIASLSSTFREIYHESNKISRFDKFIINAKKINTFVSKFSFIINPFLNFKPIRKLLEPCIGIHANRKLPRFKRLARGDIKKIYDSKILYFPDCFASYNVELSEKWKCCNIPAITKGLTKYCFKDMNFNIDMMYNRIKEGYKIIFSSPSCELAFKIKYLKFFENEKMKIIKNSIYDIHEFLISLLNENKISFKPLNKTVYVHIPCHARVLNLDIPILKLLSKIPELKISPSLDVCCGMGGTFGMKKENFDLSMKIGEPLFNEIKNQKPDIIVTNCGTCKMQIEQGTGYKVHHTMELLNASIFILH